MKNSLTILINSQFLRFAAVGGISTLIDFIIYTILYSSFSLNPGLSSAISFFISANFNFNLNNIFTFQKSERNYWSKYLIFYAIAAGGVLLSFLFTNLFVDIGVNYMIAKVISIVVILIYNYFLHSYVTFK